MPCLISFSEQFAAKLGDNTRSPRMARRDLTDLICRSRDSAENILRFQAEANGEVRGASHPYTDPEEKMVWQTAVWEKDDGEQDEPSPGAGENRAPREVSEEL